MERGRLVETGEAEALCAKPQEEYTRQLLRATPELPVGIEQGIGNREQTSTGFAGAR
jgi:ABC-type oligopeptide transport system ATPase subunit